LLIFLGLRGAVEHRFEVSLECHVIVVKSVFEALLFVLEFLKLPLVSKAPCKGVLKLPEK